MGEDGFCACNKKDGPRLWAKADGEWLPFEYVNWRGGGTTAWKHPKYCLLLSCALGEVDRQYSAPELLALYDADQEPQ
jgi:hypothetical protein